jgi:hypothetical protein
VPTHVIIGIIVLSLLSGGIIGYSLGRIEEAKRHWTEERARNLRERDPRGRFINQKP